MTFAEAVRSTERKLAIRGTMTLPSGATRVLTEEKIMAYSIDEGTSDGMLPGKVLSASHTLELANAQGEWLEGGAELGGQILAGATVQMELGVKAGGDWIYRPLGVFVVSEASSMEGGAQISLTGSDSIASELYAQFQDRLSYPATLEALWRQAVAQSRYSWQGQVPNGSATIDKAPDWKKASVRQAMAAIAMAAGCFVRVNRSGALELARCWTGSGVMEAVEPETYLGLTHMACGFGPIEALQVAPMRDADAEGEAADVTVKAREGVLPGILNTIRIENNPIFADGAAHLQALMRGTLGALQGMELREASFRWRGNPELRVGDRIRLTDRRGRATETVILQQKLRFEGGFSAEIGCSVPQEDTSGVPRAITPEGGVNASMLVGTVDGKLLAVESVTARSIAAQAITAEKIAARSIGTEMLQAGSVTADKLDAGTVNAAVLNAVSAHIQKLAAGEITADELSAALAQIARAEIENAVIDSAQIRDAAILRAKIADAAIGTAKIADAAITTAKIGSAAVQTAQIALGAITTALIDAGAVGTVQIADGSITDAKIVDLTADKISAGILATERLLLRGEGGLFYEINAQAGGLTSSRLSEEQYKRAISGTALVARSVTADRLAARSITANEIAAGTITAAEIDVAQLFSAEATIDQLNAVDIRGNGYLKLSVQEALDSVRVGARNYLRGSRDLKHGEDYRLEARQLSPIADVSIADMEAAG